MISLGRETASPSRSAPAYSPAITASVTSRQVALPPKSPVRIFPAFNTANVAFSMAADSLLPPGLASRCPLKMELIKGGIDIMIIRDRVGFILARNIRGAAVNGFIERHG